MKYLILIFIAFSSGCSAEGWRCATLSYKTEEGTTVKCECWPVTRDDEKGIMRSVPNEWAEKMGRWIEKQPKTELIDIKIDRYFTDISK